MKRMIVAGLMVAAGMLGGCASETEPDETPPAEAVKAPIEDDTTAPAYGSTYNSNCYCLFCVKYCDVDGKTVKSGTCC